jgi:hypothetical protein
MLTGAEKRSRQEWHYYFENTRRWRNLRKTTVAQVHGNVFSAGLMLMWACDLIVAAEKTVAYARRLARVPAMAALLIKESVNQTVDAMGFTTALNSCFTLHELNHAHWAEISGGATAIGTVEYGMDDWRAAPPLHRAVRSEV